MCPICNKNLSTGREGCVTYDREELLLFGSIQEAFYLIKFNHCGFFLKHHLNWFEPRWVNRAYYKCAAIGRSVFPLMEVPSEGYRKSYIETFYILTVGCQRFQELAQELKNNFLVFKRFCLESKQWAARLMLF